MSLGKGIMLSHYNSAKKLLEVFEIEYEEERSKSKVLESSCFSKSFKKASLSGEPYSKVYKTARDYKDYNLFLPRDGSFFQFSYDKKNMRDELRFAYYESPFKELSYKEFLKEHDFSYLEFGDALIEEYQQYVSETELKENVTNIRYDYSENQYKELVHPTSHIHIGQKNQIRLQLSYMMLPTNFVAFIIRNVYWDDWKSLITSDEKKRTYLANCNFSNNINRNFFSEIDKQDIYIKNG